MLLILCMYLYYAPCFHISNSHHIHISGTLDSLVIIIPISITRRGNIFTYTLDIPRLFSVDRLIH